MAPLHTWEFAGICSVSMWQVIPGLSRMLDNLVGNSGMPAKLYSRFYEHLR